MSVNLGRVAYVEKGAYDSGTTYEKKDVVLFNGGSYVFIADTPAAGKQPTDTAYWQPLIDTAPMLEATANATEAAAAANEARQNIQKDLAGKAAAIFADASGDMVHITDGAAMPVKSLITHIAPVQEGEGDPSPDNVRAISGWDAAKAVGCGQNLLERKPGMQPVNLKKGTKLYFARFGIDTGFSLYALSGKEITSDWEPIGIFSPMLSSVTLTKDYRWMGIHESAYYVLGANGNFMVSLEPFDDFAPYQGQTLTATLPETVYGGTLDWGTGVLTVDRMRELLLNDGGWMQGETNPNFYTNSNYGKKMYYERGDKSTLICTHGVWMATNTTPTVGTPSGCVYGYLESWIGMTSDYSTLDEFAAWLDAQQQAGTPVTVVYKLVTPYTIQLTPQQLDTLKGINNIWSDAGKTEVTYTADTKMYIDQKIAAIAAAIV